MVYYVVAAVLAFMTAAWLVGVRRHNHGYVDRAWGAAFVVVALTALATAEARTARSWLAASLVVTWGARLAAHLVWRDRGQGPDWRHRQPIGPLRALVTLYWAQGFAAVGVGVPVLAVMQPGQPDLGWLDAVGVVVWATGFACEAVADYQLARFRRGASTAVLDSGLWRYSRHPNYFGDAVQWWGLGLVAVGAGAGAWWALCGPAAMTVVLLRFSGVSAMDAHMRETRGEDWERYVRRTSGFVPWPPKEQADLLPC